MGQLRLGVREAITDAHRIKLVSDRKRYYLEINKQLDSGHEHPAFGYLWGAVGDDYLKACATLDRAADYIHRQVQAQRLPPDVFIQRYKYKAKDRERER